MKGSIDVMVDGLREGLRLRQKPEPEGQCQKKSCEDEDSFHLWVTFPAEVMRPARVCDADAPPLAA